MSDIILYASIVKQPKSILCEYTDCSGNFGLILQKALKILKNKNNDLQNQQNNNSSFRSSFTFGDLKIICLFTDNIYYILLTTWTDSFKSLVTIYYKLLYKLLDLLYKKYTKESLVNAKSYSLADFVQIIKENIDLFNESDDQISLFKEYSNKLDTINLDEKINDKTFNINLDFSILSKEQVHEDIENEEDYNSALEIRSSINIKNKILNQKKKRVSKDDIESTGINDLIVTTVNNVNNDKSNKELVDESSDSLSLEFSSYNEEDIRFFKNETLINKKIMGKKKRKKCCSFKTIIILFIIIIFLSIISVATLKGLHKL